MLFLKIYISQGSVALQLRVVIYLVSTLLHIFHRMCWWKKIWKLVNIWRRYGQKFAAFFFDLPCILRKFASRFHPFWTSLSVL